MKKQRIRKDIKIIKLIVWFIILIISIVCIVRTLFGNEVKNSDIVLYNYSSDFNYKYQVNNTENEYVDYSDNKDYSAYVTNLIKDIDINYKYNFSNNYHKEENITYRYNVVGKLYGYYSKDGEEQKIIEKDYVIVDLKESTVKASSFSIDENFKINLAEQNALINKFKQELDMQITSKYDVVLNIEIEGITQGKAKFSPSLSIEIGSKTTKITGDNNVVETLSTTSDNSNILNEVNTKQLVIYGLIAAVAFLRIIYLAFFTVELSVMKNSYKSEINYIMRSYQDKMVAVNSSPPIDGKNVIGIENVDELIKLSEELYKPILCYENDEETETDFIVISDDTVYIYVVKK